ncbi:hypothetical protein [Rugamonas sp. DEMB1]|uniref:hypothetical protein n=1 Tax=Rugamonas sp. DEMB1 TaxID=3039386 RepID=UPI0024496475|nr:hypothetical protein [Rugamonas sp. DEMB1]WGG51966.1 hypothetical protein QC826_07150 [Rugamonas sp. DEMB1]
MDDRLIAFEAHFNAILPTLATKADVEALRAEIHKWMLGTIVGMFIGFAGLLLAMQNMARPPAVVQPPAPGPAQRTLQLEAPPPSVIIIINPPPK